MLRLIFYQTDINVVIKDMVFDCCGFLDHNLCPQVRIVRLVSFEKRREYVGSDGNAGRRSGSSR